MKNGSTITKEPDIEFGIFEVKRYAGSEPFHQDGRPLNIDLQVVGYIQ
jgi:hypothetical protein